MLVRGTPEILTHNMQYDYKDFLSQEFSLPVPFFKDVYIRRKVLFLHSSNSSTNRFTREFIFNVFAYLLKVSKPLCNVSNNHEPRNACE
jgi:hypothetical protein